MGIATFPSVSSPIKSIQRGSAGSAGNISITAVTTTKTIVNSFSTSSSGTVAASGSINAASGTGSAVTWQGANLASFTRGQGGASSRYGTTYSSNQSGSVTINSANINAHNISLNATNLSGGSTNLVSAVYGAYLVDSTTIYATGPCRYEVVEYY